MKVYIASSWKNQHGVELLTKELRTHQSIEVASWIENNYGENHNHVTKKFDFETWVNSKESDQSFEFDTNGAGSCDLFIYYGPAGKDAAAECGIAFAKGIPMLGLHAKGEDFGLMRKMFLNWYSRIDVLIIVVKLLQDYFFKSMDAVPANLPHEVLRRNFKSRVQEFIQSNPHLS